MIRKSLFAAALAAALPAAAAEPPRIEIIQMLKSGEWHLAPGGILIIDTLTLSSFADYPVKDMELKCTTYGNSGTALTEVKITLFDKIDPKGVKYFSKVNLGPVNSQTTHIVCEVIAALPG